MQQGIENALITGFRFQADRGHLTFWIDLQFAGGGGQSVGGYPLTGDIEVSPSRATQAIYNMLKILDVESTDDLAGKYVRIKHHHSGLNPTIGHIIEDRWWDIREELGVQ